MTVDWTGHSFIVCHPQNRGQECTDEQHSRLRTYEYVQSMESTGVDGGGSDGIPGGGTAGSVGEHGMGISEPGVGIKTTKDSHHDEVY